MRNASRYLSGCALLVALVVAYAGEFNPLQIETREGGTVVLRLEAAAGSIQRIEFSDDLQSWTPMRSFAMPASGQFSLDDASAGASARRHYRAVPLPAGSLTGDYLDTASGDVLIHPVDHASFVMQWDGKTIYNDPVGGAGVYAGIPIADLVMVGHRHGDHFSNSTLEAITDSESVIVAPQDVFDRMSSTLKTRTTTLPNGANADLLGLNVAAIPAYNANHPEGRDNGYVITIGNKRIYMSGDTGDTGEMRALENIDVAFVVMNLPWTMSVDQAASAIRDFRPAVVYPYHFRNQDASFADFARLEDLIGSDLRIELRIREWY